MSSQKHSKQLLCRLTRNTKASTQSCLALLLPVLPGLLASRNHVDTRITRARYKLCAIRAQLNRFGSMKEMSFAHVCHLFGIQVNWQYSLHPLHTHYTALIVLPSPLCIRAMCYDCSYILLNLLMLSGNI